MLPPAAEEAVGRLLVSSMIAGVIAAWPAAQPQTGGVMQTHRNFERETDPPSV